MCMCMHLLALLDRRACEDYEVRAVLTQALDRVDGVHLGVRRRPWHGQNGRLWQGLPAAHMMPPLGSERWGAPECEGQPRA
jgi:hypothetical protein